MLERIILHGTLQQEGLVTDYDDVLEFLPEVRLYDAWHREWGSGYAVECEDTDGRKWRCWLSTIRERDELTDLLIAKWDFPFYVLKENEFYAVRSGYGMNPEPYFSADPEDVFVRLKEQKHMRLKHPGEK